MTTKLELNMDYTDKLRAKLKTLSETVWEGKGTEENINDWLNNFQDDDLQTETERQKIIARYILSNFLYFDVTLINELLKTVYNTLFRRSIINNIRCQNNATLDKKIIERQFKVELDKTRFLGMGNPSESGSHLLYYFRQANSLSKNLFINTREIFRQGESRKTEENKISTEKQLANSSVLRYIFLDDFCGTGTQAIRYSGKIVERIKMLHNEAKVYYFSLIGIKSGVKKVTQEARYDRVESVLELDETFKCFSDESRYFKSKDLPEFIDKAVAKKICTHYGEKVKRDIPEEQKIDALGFGDSQLLLGFHHNIPNNTLPVIWAKTDSFTPAFTRHSKYK